MINTDFPASSEVLKWQNFDFDSFLQSVTHKQITRIIEKVQNDNASSLDEFDFLALLSPAANKHLEDMAQLSQSISRKHFGKSIHLYTPLYLTNYCTNDCKYCGYSSQNNIKRIQLNEKHIINECKNIAAEGIKHILLLTGGDKKRTPFSYIQKAVEIAAQFFNSISIEMYAMTAREYWDLKQMGVNNLTLYQETYCEETYSSIHVKGEKSDFYNRLHAPERAAKADFNSITFGVLLGLSPGSIDFFKAGIHSYYMQKEYPAIEVGIALPRLKKAEGNYKPPNIISDIEFVKYICAYRIFMNRSPISLSTRENESFRNNVIPLGISSMSAGSKTSVGAHTKGIDSNEQFSISDTRSVKVISDYLSSQGYQAVYKDWDILCT